MEIKITTTQILKALQVLSWIIFIGLCIQAGGLIVNSAITLFINPSGVKNFWEGSDYLSSVYTFDHGQFMVMAIIMCIVATMKAIMFYLIVKLFTDKNLKIAQPFSPELSRFMIKQSYFALVIGGFSLAGLKYSLWLTLQGTKPADLQALNLGGADVWIFMAVILFLIVQLVKKGIEIQNENDLTV